jgi:ATP-dependent DNA helicase RecG
MKQLDTRSLEALYDRGVLVWETQPVRRATLADLDTNLIEIYLAQRPERSRLAGRLSNRDEILLNIGCATITKDEAQQDIIRPTNAGMLLFGSDPQQFILQAEVVCVLYKDKIGKQRYADRRILHGTITQQIDQAEAFFRQYVPVAGYMEGFHRIDVPDYPLEALREAVVNAVVHRDYSLPGEAVRVFYYPDRIEIHNPGMLMPGLSLEELRQGKARSKPRNPVLATVLRDFPGGYMERVGSGIMFMIDQMRELGRPDPQFTEQGEFVVTFYRSFPSEDGEKDTSQMQVPSPTAPSSSRKRRQKLALQYVHTHGFITYDRYQAMTGIPENVAIQDLEALRKQGSLRAIEQKHGGRYYRL